MKKFTSPSQKLGKIGEDIACKYLVNKGYFIIERNFTLKCGEIDIVASKGSEIRFVEVKAIRYNDGASLIKPEENVHSNKIKKLAKACLIYADTHKIIDREWQIDVVAIEYDADRKVAYVRHHECVY